MQLACGLTSSKACQSTCFCLAAVPKVQPLQDNRHIRRCCVPAATCQCPVITNSLLLASKQCMCSGSSSSTCQVAMPDALIAGRTWRISRSQRSQVQLYSPRLPLLWRHSNARSCRHLALQPLNMLSLLQRPEQVDACHLRQGATELEGTCPRGQMLLHEPWQAHRC